MPEVVYTQGTIWDLLRIERELPPGLKEVQAFLGVLSLCDREIVRTLDLERRHGRDDFPVAAMWRLAALKLFLRKGRFSDLRGELNRSSDLARILGFKENLPNSFQLPTASALSRFHTKLKSETYQRMIQRIHAKTVDLLRAEDPAIGEHTACDSTDVRTHGKSARKAKDNKAEVPATDREASWSIKTKYRKDAQGKVQKETKKTFGYKAFLSVDVHHPVVLAQVTTTGSQNDHTMAQTLIDGTIERLGEDVVKTCAMDKGFDSADTVRYGHEKGIAVMVPVREVPQELQNQKPEDRELTLGEAGNIVWDKYSGQVACYETSKDGQRIRREMNYAGFERDRESHKFRCPLGEGASSSCSAFSTCGAGACGKQGRQIRVPMETDIRRFAPIYPRSKQWKRLYKGRTAVERVNSYFKEVFRLEDHCLRGKRAIALRVSMASITLNLRTLLALRAAKQEQKAAA